MKLPKKITPDPIVEAIAEIRFDTDFPSEAVFGVIYNLLGKKFPKIERLPILQIPNKIRDNDPKLKYQPLFRMSNEKYLMQIGPRMCSVAIKQNYYGWAEFLNEIVFTFEMLRDNNVIKNIQRLAIRYIDYFEEDIFENIKLEIKLDSKDIIKNQTSFKNLIIEEPYQMLINIAKDISISKGNVNLKGSLFDVDTQLIKVDNSALNNLKEHFNGAHELEKNYFFSLLKESFIAKFNPEYDDK